MRSLVGCGVRFHDDERYDATDVNNEMFFCFSRLATNFGTPVVMIGPCTDAALSQSGTKGTGNDR